MTVWTFNGSTDLSVTIDSTPGQEYSLIIDGGDGATDTETAVGATLTLSVTGLSGLAGGDPFGAFVKKGGVDIVAPDGDYVASTIFTVGSTDEHTTEAVWSYDGDKTFSVTFPTIAGHGYNLPISDPVNGLYNVATITGDGSTMVLSGALPSTPTGGFLAYVYDDTIASGGDFMDRLFTAGAASTGTEGNPTIPIVVARVLLCDLATDATILDLTNIFTSLKVSPRGNRPLAITVTVPGHQVRGNWDDGDGKPIVSKGIRTLKYYRKGKFRGHVRVHTPEWDLDENGGSVMITGFDPMAQTLARPVRDATGNLAVPVFASPISGAEILKEAIDNTVSNSGGPGDMEGALPLDTSEGTFDTTIGTWPTDAVDLSAELTDMPMTIGDLYALLTQTGRIDVICDPVDTSMGFDPGIIGKLSIVNQAGTDRTGSVNFDFDTGDRNIAKLRRVDDITTLCNKLIYYLGPKVGPDEMHWKGNVSATELSPVDLSAYLTLEEASRDVFGTWAQFKFFDSNDENTARPLFHELWKNEVTLRVNGKEMFFLTPVAADDDTQLPPDVIPFEPFDDYDVFDTVAINASDLCGRTVSGETQRIYGFDLTMDGSESVERVGELVTSADQE